MTALYRLHILTAAGVLKHILAANPGGNDPTKGGPLELAYTNVVNGYGTCAFILDGNHEALVDLTYRCQVEVWRSDPNAAISWYRDWSGFFVDEKRWLKDGQLQMFTAICVGDAFLLQDRAILWYANTANRSAFTGAKAEVIMKTLVKYNCTADASTGNGRIKDGTIAGLSVDTPGGTNGTTQDWLCAWDNLLKSLQNLAIIGGGDFDVIKNAAGTAWVFNWYTGQRGTDRTASVVFGLERGNMANPVHTITRRGRKTAIAVGGDGVDLGREVVVRTATGYSASNNIEEFYNGASQIPTTEALQAMGDQELYKCRDIEKLEFDPIQTPGCQYGREYFLGDIVTARFVSTTTPKIIKASMSVTKDYPFGKVEIGLDYV
jgi:hypothetical protein